MADRSSDSALILPFIGTEREGLAPQRSSPEGEVVALFDQLQDRVLRYLLGFGIGLPDAEEILQEVFLALFQHLRRGKSRENLRGWIFRVAHNLALKRREAYTNAYEAATTTSGMDDLCVDPGPNPEDQLASKQIHERLQAILRVLPERDQCCLSLRAEGLRYREIAEVLNMSLGAVSLSLARSLARLGRASQW